MKTIELSNKGEVLTHTELHSPPEGFDAPLQLALVGLESEAVVLCMRHRDNKRDIEIGDQVSVILGDEGKFYYLLP